MLEQLPAAVGEALEGVRAGLDQTLFQAVDLRQGMGAIKLSSLAFADHAPMPQKCSADGPGVSPPLHWSGIPSLTAQVVLVVEDADSPTPHPLVHAIVVESLPNRTGEGRTSAPALTEDARTGALAEGAMSSSSARSPMVSMGLNSLLQSRWLPPDPPPGHGVHRYVFQMFALGAGEALPDAPGRDAVREAIVQRGLASGCLIGTYERPSGRIDEPLASPLATGGTQFATAP